MSKNLQEIEPNELSQEHIAYLTTNLAYYLGTGYNDDEITKQIEIVNNHLNPLGWEMIATSRDLGENRGGYNAVIYKNQATNEVIISSAGTDFANLADLRDDFSLAFGNIPRNKISPIQNFINKLILNGDIDNNSEISTYGHSLGSVTAQMTAVELLSLGLNVTKSITLENPGSKKTIIQMIENGLFSGETNVDLQQIANISEIYNRSPNFITTSGEQIGKLRVVPLSKTQLDELKSEKKHLNFEPSIFSKLKQLFVSGLRIIIYPIAVILNKMTTYQKEFRHHKLGTWDEVFPLKRYIPVENWSLKEQIILTPSQTNIELMKKAKEISVNSKDKNPEIYTLITTEPVEDEWELVNKKSTAQKPLSKALQQNSQNDPQIPTRNIRNSSSRMR